MLSVLSIPLLVLSIAKSCSAWYQPAVGTSWQCALDPDISSLDLPVEIYDIDLFTNSASVIDQLHQKGKQVICYFSAGTYELNRPDSAEIKADAADVGESLADEGWLDENWLNIRSDRIVDIMKRRIDTALAKGCDGVDPDNGMKPWQSPISCGVNTDSLNSRRLRQRRRWLQSSPNIQRLNRLPQKPQLLRPLRHLLQVLSSPQSPHHRSWHWT